MSIIFRQKHEKTSPVPNQGEGNANISNINEIKLEDDKENKNKAKAEKTANTYFYETDYYEDPDGTVEEDVINIIKNKEYTKKKEN